MRPPGEPPPSVGKGPVRGFPPAPGQPPPRYPPGQCAPWNRLVPGRGEAYEPEYPQLAVSDAAADVTSTQTWQAIGDGPDGTGAWTEPGGRGGRVTGPRVTAPRVT